MSTNPGMTADEGLISAPALEKPKLDIVGQVQRIAREAIASPAFWPGVAILLGVCLTFSTLMMRLPELWESRDGYYSHGYLVPFISGYVVYRWWPRLSKIPVKPGYIAIVPLLLSLWVTRVAHINTTQALLSICFLSALLFSAWFIAGWRWMLALAGPILYLSFALPLWSGFIEFYTNPLQIISSQVAFQLIRLFGFDAYQDGPTDIIVNSFHLNVAVPCSGLKLVVALSAFAVFFVMIAKLKPLANIFMLAMIIPLAVFINGLRIALIGVVGEMYGQEAGLKFHDYSGYITLGICFYILFKTARLLGWKD